VLAMDIVNISRMNIFELETNGFSKISAGLISQTAVAYDPALICWVEN